MLTIESVRAAPVTNPAALGRSGSGKADGYEGIDHMNPLAGDRRFPGPTDRLRPPWSEVICVVEAGGSFGVGMTTMAGPTVPMINEFLGPMIRGEDATDVDRLWDMMTITCGSHFGTAGGVSYAISAVDLALWDLIGKVRREPVYALLGPADPQPVPCYATGFDVAWYQEIGFEAFKLACPWDGELAPSIDRTTGLLTAARGVIGPDAHLMLDCWGVQRVDDAIAIGNAVEEFGLTWVEDAIYPEDWSGYPLVRSGLPDVRLAAGERWYTDRPFARAVDEGWVDVVQPDPLWVGGVTPTRRIAAMVRDTDVELALHCGANDSFGQHLAYGLEGNRWAEMFMGCERGASLMDSYRATPGMTFPVDGCIVPSDAPGFGLELGRADIQKATGPRP